MATRNLEFNEIINLIRGEVQTSYPNADFTEGSFYNIFAGAFALGFQELQGYSFDLYSRTFFLNPALVGTDLEELAIDHYGEGARRPPATGSVGIIKITKDDDTEVKSVAVGDQFNSDGQSFQAVQAVSSPTGQASFNVVLRSVGLGENTNVRSKSEWETTLEDVAITNDDAFVGGTNIPTDEEYRRFIQRFVASLQSGTAEGIEAKALTYSYIFHAKLIRNLESVGTLQADGTLETSPTRFNVVRPILYVFGNETALNTAVLNTLKADIDPLLSAGEHLEYQSAQPVTLNLTLNFTFASSQNALELSQDDETLRAGIKAYVDSLAIGTDFDRANFQTNLQAFNNWTSLFSVSVTLPTGDVDVTNSQKLVLGTLTITKA